MSAICGAVGLDGQPVEVRDIEPMLAASAGLGPDGRAGWSGRAGGLGVAVGVARRHRVPEDAADRQPLAGADGVVLAADVVLANRGELARRLGLRDRPDVPDSALVLAAYLRWGVDCLSRLSGDFALAVVDPRRGGVLLARDQVGIRPLHVHVGPGRLVFASTALALAGYLGASAEIDLTRLAGYLAGVPSAGRSWIAGVEPVEPGGAIWVRPGGTRRWRYWSAERPVAAGVPTGEQVGELRAAFDRAVRGRLRRTGGVGVALSGGLDSTSVAATAAAALAPAPVHTYTSVPPAGWDPGRGVELAGFEPDERHLVVDLAGRYPNLRTRFIDAVGAPFLAGYNEIFALGGVPPRNPCNVTWLGRIHRAAVADGARTLLTGSRGNLYFSADDPGWLVALLRRGRLGPATRELRGWAAASGGSAWQVLRASVLPALLPATVRDAARAWPGPAPRPGCRGGVDLAERWFAGDALRPELRDHLDVELAELAERIAAAPREMSALGLRTQAAAAELHAATQARYGMHAADPTADVRVIELCAAQPGWVRRRDGLARAGCRAAMADRLPDSIRLRTARGAQLPDWLDRMTDARAELAAEVRATSEHPATRRLIDVDLLAAAIRDWPAGPDPHRVLTRTYRVVLLRSLVASRYLRWFADRPPTTVGDEMRSELHSM